MGAYVHTSILSQEDNDERTQLMQLICTKINTSSYDAVRRLTWELALTDFKESKTLLDKGNYT